MEKTMHPATQAAGDEQARLWNGPAGNAWVDAQQTLDQLFRPLEKLLVETACAAPASRVLDVGCGTGGTTLAIARAVGGGAECTGIDISQPMIAAARIRAGREGIPARFVCANAQTHAFEPASFDSIVSRLGVMFFDDPVRAFANLRHAAKDGAGLSFVAWRSAAENPFMTTAERAAAPLLPNLPPRVPGAPGQFAFADRERVQAVLEESGWHCIDIRPVDLHCTMPEKDLIGYLSRLGPVGIALLQADEETRARVIHTVRAAFEAYVHGDEVRLTAACWLVKGRADA
ncbi:class I SAM-dependent methyltransferase [Variovorax guangxiensis]|uniref:SAM-dependent methyltransferase n=1 Tax=Variovorax guangxiensis TaxID=1775474 RepID=A0A840FIN5_9BURK|nr:class I SAM-dependent methyltransferase [Variovorax guangxiensis]MBB4220005.1 SAM-dependent methyltransferase [Variovorax guangxiensis]